MYEEFGVDNFDFTVTPMHFLYLDMKKYIISMTSILLKQRLRKKKHVGRLARKSLDLCRENAFDWCNANKLTNKDGSVSTKGWESSHYQEWFPFQVIVIFIAY